jgi:hypothetical protein
MDGVPPALAARLAPAAAVLLCVVSVAACGRSGRASSATTVQPSTTTVSTTLVRPTATTSPLPTAPQTSAAGAAAEMVTAWSLNNRAAARTAASQTAVAELFAARYPGGALALSRGCSAAFPPIVCTYGPPGGADPNDPLYELYVSHTAKGWYVSSVRIFG